MLVDFDPVIFSLGPISIRWYAMMYVIGFLLGGFLLKRLSTKGLFRLPKEHIDSFLTYLILGLFFGARLFYVFVYNWDDFLQNPQDILSVWKGGLSFHGGVIGITIACVLFARKHKLHPLHIADTAATVGAQGLLFGRLGNFINGELYGRMTDAPWGMIFPSGGPFKRHPSQLYESLGEGLILFLIMWLGKKRLNTVGLQSAFFLTGYGVMRFIVEFFREADVQMGYYFGNLFTMGQILCFIMIIAGILMFTFFYHKKISP